MSPSDRVIAQAENYEIAREGACAVLRAWSRPDLSFDRGAQLAEQMCAHMTRLAGRADPGIQGLVCDLQKAPPLIGKRTRAAFAKLAATSDESGMRLSILASSSAHRALLKAALGDRRHVRVFANEQEAWAWARGEAPLGFDAPDAPEAPGTPGAAEG